MNCKPLPYFVVPRWFALVNFVVDLYEQHNHSEEDWTIHGYVNPWFILVDKKDPKLICHEQRHGFQMKRDGWRKWHIKYAEDYNNPEIGYWKMDYEVDARNAEEVV